jgi:hypothetical protein
MEVILPWPADSTLKAEPESSPMTIDLSSYYRLALLGKRASSVVVKDEREPMTQEEEGRSIRKKVQMEPTHGLSLTCRAVSTMPACFTVTRKLSAHPMTVAVVEANTIILTVYS